MYCDTYAPALMKLMIQYERGRINDKSKSLNGYLNYKISYLLKCASDQIDPPQCIISLKCLPHSSIENQIRKSDSCRRIQLECPQLCSKTESTTETEADGRASHHSVHCLQTHKWCPFANSHKFVLFLKFHFFSQGKI